MTATFVGGDRQRCHRRVEVRGLQLVADLSTLPKPEQWKDL
jgi:hypothetical protein